MAAKQAEQAAATEENEPKTMEHGYSTYLSQTAVNNPRTAQLYENRIAKFREFLLGNKGKDLDELTPADFNDWIQFRRQKGCKVLGDVKILRAFYNWLFIEHYLPENKLKFVKMKPFLKEADAKIERNMTDRDMRKLIKAAQDLGPKVFAFVTLLCYVGLRIAEATRMKNDAIKRECTSSSSEGEGLSTSDSDSDSESDNSEDDDDDDDDDEVSVDLPQLQKVYNDFVTKGLPNNKKNDVEWIKRKLCEYNRKAPNDALTSILVGWKLLTRDETEDDVEDAAAKPEYQYSIKVPAGDSKNSKARTIRIKTEFGAILYEYAQKQLDAGKVMMFPSGVNARPRDAFWFYYNDTKKELRFDHPGKTPAQLKQLARGKWVEVGDNEGKYQQAADYYNQSLATRTVSSTGAREWFFKARDKAKINKNITPHWCRHWYCSTQLKLGAPLKNVATSMGHSNMMVTDRYAHNNSSFNGSEMLPGMKKKRKHDGKKRKHKKKARRKR